jgi:DNA-3-methyladenine glycosylase II
MNSVYKKACAHFTKTDPVMASLLASLGTISLPEKITTDEYAFHLYSSIISQQLSVKAAEKILDRFISLVGDPHDTYAILNLSPDELRAVGLSYQKAGYIQSIAENIANKTVRIEHLDELSDELVIESLTKIKGVGKWTAEMFLIFTLGRSDVFSVGDLGLLRAVQRLYNVPDLRKEELLEKSLGWSPYRSIVSLALWHSLDNKPH